MTAPTIEDILPVYTMTELAKKLNISTSTAYRRLSSTGRIISASIYSTRVNKDVPRYILTKDLVKYLQSSPDHLEHIKKLLLRH